MQHHALGQGGQMAQGLARLRDDAVIEDKGVHNNFLITQQQGGRKVAVPPLTRSGRTGRGFTFPTTFGLCTCWVPPLDALGRNASSVLPSLEALFYTPGVSSSAVTRGFR